MVHYTAYYTQIFLCFTYSSCCCRWYGTMEVFLATHCKPDWNCQTFLNIDLSRCRRASPCFWSHVYTLTRAGFGIHIWLQSDALRTELYTTSVLYLIFHCVISIWASLTPESVKTQTGLGIKAQRVYPIFLRSYKALTQLLSSFLIIMFNHNDTRWHSQQARIFTCYFQNK